MSGRQVENARPVPMVSDNHMGTKMGAILAEHDAPGPEYALVECAAPEGCSRRSRIEWSAGRSDADLRAEFASRGWTVGPTRCPDHVVSPPGSVSAAPNSLPGTHTPDADQ